LLTNQAEIPEEITAIPHIYKLMTKEALAAQAALEHPQLPNRRRAQETEQLASLKI